MGWVVGKNQGGGGMGSAKNKQSFWPENHRLKQ